MSRFAAAPRSLTVETPEHVAVRFQVADLGSRLTALLLDLLVQVIALALLSFSFALVPFVSRDVLPAFWIVAFFLLRNFYFTLAEIRMRGRTPGKKRLGLRVVARDGGPLTADMIFARNLTRELETFLPLTLLLAPQDLAPGYPWWVQLATLAWVAALTALPLLNRKRARLGDLLAGTVVVHEPATELLEDLAEEGGEVTERTGLTFTDEQLAIYGIEELQVLERVLRRPPSDRRDELLADIAGRVRRKIGWEETGPPVPPVPFLRAFYAAQRSHLETRMLLGQRRERKVR